MDYLALSSSLFEPSKAIALLSCFILLNRDKIFVCGCAENSRHVFYLFEPPPIKSGAGAQAETIGKWVVVGIPENSDLGHVQRIQSAIIFEI